LSALFGPGATLNKKLAFQAQSKPLSSALFGPGETLGKKLHERFSHTSKVPTSWAEQTPAVLSLYITV